MLPVEILHLIAAVSPASYRAMLSLPPFARSLDPGTIADYMITFGHSIEISRTSITWRRHGQLHRLDGPAVERDCGSAGKHASWYRNGKLYRLNGPASEYGDGNSFWYHDGYLHRDGGPAMEFMDGTKCWYQYGQLHREDGPAVERPDGTNEWWYRDVQCRVEQ